MTDRDGIGLSDALDWIHQGLRHIRQVQFVLLVLCVSGLLLVRTAGTGDPPLVRDLQALSAWLARVADDPQVLGELVELRRADYQPIGVRDVFSP